MNQREACFIKKVFVISPTFRDPQRDNRVRLLGPVALLGQMTEQDFNGDIYVAIIDSSPVPHPFFSQLKTKKNDNFIYLHVPDRNAISPEVKAGFPNAMAFIPDDREINRPEWQAQVLQSTAWDRFLPWDEGYPMPETIAQQILKSRPTIGMARNAGIAALEEKFGTADLIIYADDDDYRGSSYVRELAEGVGKHDFTRMFKYITCAIRENEARWGLYDIDFEPDVNGNWLPLGGTGNTELKNSLGKGAVYSSTIEDKFSRLKCLAFPPISYDGALHAYKFDLWKKAIRSFGGVPITSICEDVLFYKKCHDTFGENFSAIKTTVTNPSFVRMSDGTNTSVIEWTRDLNEKDVPEWAMEAVRPLQDVLKKSQFDAEEYFKRMALEYENKGRIAWPSICTKTNTPSDTI